MGKAFKLKPKNFQKKPVVKEKVWKESPYVKPKSNIVRPVYFDFMNYDEPPKVKFNVTPSDLWSDDEDIVTEPQESFRDEE